MTRYYDLCDWDVFSDIRDVLTEEYGINEDVLSFAFDIYGRNEETLENICYYYGIDIDELLDHAGIEDDEDEDEETEDEDEKN